MAKFKLDNYVKEKLAEAGKKKANELAEDAKRKLIDKYVSLIDFYYADYMPKLDNNGVPYYIRTFNLYKSYKPYKKNSHNSIFYGGIEVTATKMRDYDSIQGYSFSADRLLEKYIYTPNSLPSATWHGGDWHGGYGVMAQFSVYEEMKKYQNYLVKKYSNSKN